MMPTATTARRGPRNDDQHDSRGATMADMIMASQTTETAQTSGELFANTRCADAIERCRRFPVSGQSGLER